MPGGRLDSQGDPVPVPQHRAEKHKKIVVSRSHYDLVRRTVHSSCLVEVTADRISQPVLALGTSEPEQLCPIVCQALAGELSPRIIGKAFQIHPVWSKIILILLFFRSLLLCLCPAHPAKLIQSFDLRYKISPVRLRFDISFREQLLVCQFHGAPAHIQMAAECTRRRELFPAWDGSLLDFFFYIRINLLIQGDLIPLF